MTEASGSGTLRTWKEIAEYLGVTVRTAQIWERERGLPVRRLPGQHRGSVFAAIKDLDQWQHSLNTDPPVLESQPGVHQHKLRYGVAVAAAGIATAAIVVFLIRGGSQPHTFHLAGSVITALDASGGEVWKHGIQTEGLQHESPNGDDLTWLGDLEGDGANEILLAYNELEDGKAVLSCFSDDGEERWQFRPGREVRTKTRIFRPPFRVNALAVSDGKPPRIAVAAQHHSFFPNQVAVLNVTGEMVGEYWHSGPVSHLEIGDLNSDGREELYLAGISNSRRMAELVVLNLDRVQGASEEPAEYQLAGLGSTQELARLFFSPSSLSLLSAPYNKINNLRVSDGTVLVETLEDQTDGLGKDPTIYYRLGKNLTLEFAEPSITFAAAHNRLRATGVLIEDLDTEARSWTIIRQGKQQANGVTRH